MVVVYYDVEKGTHRTIKNVYSVLDDGITDDSVTVCWEGEFVNYSKDILKMYLTSITLY